MNALLKNRRIERRSLAFKITGWAQVALFGWLMAWGDFSSRLEYVAVGTARIDCATAQPEVPMKGEPSGSERVNPTQCDGYGAMPGTTKPSALIAGANVASQLGWRGHYIDPTGFYYMGARNYAPDSGTFLSPDPLGHSASMDLYSYCDGDPVNHYDADGRLKTGFNSGLNGNISANAPTSSAFYFGNLIGGGVSGAATGIQNGAGGTVNALSLGNVKGAFGSDPSSFEYHSGQVGGAAIGLGVALGTGGAAYEAGGAFLAANPTLYGAVAAAAPIVYNVGNAITGENPVGSIENQGTQLSFGRKLDFLFNNGINQSNTYNASRAAANAARIGIADTVSNRTEVMRLFNQAYQDSSSIVGPGSVAGSNIREFFLPGVTSTGSKIQFIEKQGQVITIMAK